MTETPPTERAAWAIPAGALTEWLRLAAAVDQIGAVPCRTSDPEAWWPDRGDVGGLAARMTFDACSVCAARDACLNYAVAADESEGVWGGTLPNERWEIRELAA